MEGKTAAEKAAEDGTLEQEAPSWVESVGAGAAWSAVKNIVGTGHGHGHGAGAGGGGGHGHSHGGVPCDGGHGDGSHEHGHGHGHGHGNGHVAPKPAQQAKSMVMGDVKGFMAAAATGEESVFDRFIKACTEGDQLAAEELYDQTKMDVKEGEDAAEALRKLVNDECSIGYTSFHLACYHGHLEVVEWLLGLPGLDFGAKTHDEMYKLGATGLHLAVAAGSLEIVAYMVKNGFVPDVDVRDNRKCTPLIIAAQYGEVVISHYLMRNGADPRAVDQHGDTAMHWAAYKGHSDLVSLYAVGAMSGCDVPINQPDNFGQSALHLAALRGNADTVQSLLDLGAERHNPDKKGKTALNLAVEKREPRDRGRTLGQMRIEHFLEDVHDHKSLMRWVQFSGKATYYAKMAMIIHTAYAYFFIVLASRVVPASDALIQTVFFFGLVFCWQMVHRTDPGSLPDGAKAEYEAAIAEMCESGVAHYTRSEGRKLCHTSREIRPLRAKYCRALRKNVPRFDHHCPWVGNTVGLQNQVWFYCYTFCCLVCCNYWAFPYFGLAHRWVDMGGEGANWSYNVFISSLYHTFSSLFGIAMWSTHTWLASKNLTTNENINMSRFSHFMDPVSGEVRNPFDKGSVFENLAEYFGRVAGDELGIAGARETGPGSKTLAQMRQEVLGKQELEDMAV